MQKIAAGLEKAFASGGFADTSVEVLREAAGVSLRTLYKYTPSRGEMVLAALEHRHQRYMVRVFDAVPPGGDGALEAVIDGVAGWMASESAHGCLFHAAVAADPASVRLRTLLERHKQEVAARAAAVSGLTGAETDLLLIIEGLTQAWPLRHDAAVASAKHLGRLLRDTRV